MTAQPMRKTESGELVGSKMHSAVCKVKSLGPYGSMNQLAISVGPNGSQDYGYRIVKRCLKKDLIGLDPEHPDATPQGRGAVVITQKGMDYLSQQED